MILITRGKLTLNSCLVGALNPCISFKTFTAPVISAPLASVSSMTLRSAVTLSKRVHSLFSLRDCFNESTLVTILLSAIIFDACGCRVSGFHLSDFGYAALYASAWLMPEATPWQNFSICGVNLPINPPLDCGHMRMHWSCFGYTHYKAIAN